ncbi:MAG: ATP phosphoribosyltransferase regulatory subunit, partial [Ferruginibacter sp.]
EITIAIDKLDKIGLEKVKEELSSRGLSRNHIKTIEDYLNISGSNDEKLAAVEKLFAQNATGLKGIEELKYVVANAVGVNLEIDLTLARGLNYYTGIIFEAKAPAEVKMGSIGGGGRYDDLTGLFGVPDIPGVGISFGIDRIYDVMEEMDLFPKDLLSGPLALFVNLGEKEVIAAMPLMSNLRDDHISCELYPEKVKPERQFKYADKKNIPFVVIIGSNELETGSALVKNMKTGDQTAVPFPGLNKFFTDNKK